MKRYLPKSGFFLFILATLSFLAVPSCAKEHAPVKLGSNVWPGYEFFYLARDLGYYDEAKVRLVEYGSSTEVMRAFEIGAINAAALTLDEAILLYRKAGDARVIMILDSSEGADVVIGRPEVKNLRDLKGKKVGVENTALGSFVLARALQTAGMSTGDVTIVPLEYLRHEEAFNSGLVDAVVTFEPARTRLLRAGAKLLFDSSRIPGEVLDVLVARRDAMEKDPGCLKALIDGWYRAREYYSKNGQDAAKRISARLGLSPEEVALTYNGMRLPEREENRRAFESGSALEAARRTASFMLEKDLLEGGADVEKLVDGRFFRGGGA